MLFVATNRFIHIGFDKAIATISDKNMEFWCRFIHVRKDVLFAESHIATMTEEVDNRTGNSIVDNSTHSRLGTCYPSVPKFLIQHFWLVRTK